MDPRRVIIGQLSELRQRIARVERQQRRAVAALADMAPGTQEVQLTWARPYSDDSYHVTVSIICGQAALPVLRAGLKPGSKTADGCVVNVVNTGAGTIASVGLDVLATRL